MAIGGITLERARRVLDAGARSVAVIGDLLRTGDPAARVGSSCRRCARREPRRRYFRLVAITLSTICL